jgi:hypothetical protein
MIQSTKKFYILRDITFQENESYYKKGENEISKQPIFLFSHFYFSKEQRISNENRFKNKNKIRNETEEEIPLI